VNETLLDIVRANSRMPVQNEGDIYALIACAEVGETRLAAMMREFAIDGLDELGNYILATSEQATRARIAGLPDGSWDHELKLDGYDFEIELKARLTVAGGDLTVDFDGTSRASRYGINVPITYAQAYTVFGLKCIIAPDIPNNAGALAPFHVTAPEGSILNPQKPAPVSQRHVIGQLLPDTVFGCLHQAIPGRVPAEGTGCLWSMTMRSMAGARGSGNAPAFMIEPVHNGGTGGRPGSDGLSATAYPSGVMGSQVELTESTCPLIFRRRELRPDSAGVGQYRGGFGQILEIEHSAGAPFMLGSAVERVTYPPRGRQGGQDGRAGELRLASGAKLPAKGENEIPAGDRLIVMTPGGGGYGDPGLRDPALTEADKRDGLVTVDGG
jgi:N-methylhydantoinase B